MNAAIYTSIFWPSQCQESGYVFGWINTHSQNRTIVVAGVLPASVPQHLQQLQNDNHISTLGSLKVLGKCSIRPHKRKWRRRRRAPVLVLDEMEEIGPFRESDIVFYHRHQPNTQRFYSMNAPDELSSSRKSGSGINQKVIDQLNMAGAINTAVQHRQPFQSSTSNPNQRNRPLIAQISDTFLNILSISLLLFSNPIQTLCNAPLMSKLFLEDVSLTFQQIDVRTAQVSVLVSQMADLRSWKSSGQGRVESYSIKYTSFFNTVWLILNDITIGYAFGVFLCENHSVLARMTRNGVETVLIVLPQSALRWLDSWPAGLKLNTELSRFYAGTFVDLVDVWGGILRRVIFPHLPTTIYTFGFVSSYGSFIGGLGGMSMSIALFYDMFVVFTLHVYVCYAISGVVYERVLWGMGSLWRLFRGKRFNVLRNRTDSWEYDTDQLLFGTILFTLLVFLFPTILAYYALFALLRLATILIQASLEMQLAFVNHFPLFAVMLRVKDPERLPGGVYFDFGEVLSDTRQEGQIQGGVDMDSDEVVVLLPILKNQPVTLRKIFFQYTRLWTRLASHYNPLRLLKSVLLGRLLVPIPRDEIRYDKTGVGNMEIES